MAYDNKDFSSDRDSRNNESLYSKRVKAGKRRTYFFDVRATRGNDNFITITESKKRFDDNGYDRHKMFLYKEDFNKFLAGLTETINYVKTDLMPDFDFDAFNHDDDEEMTAAPRETVAAATTVADEPLVVTEDNTSVEEWKI